MAINPNPMTPKTKSKVSSLVVMASVAVFLGLLAAAGIWQYLVQTQQKVKELTVTRAVVVAGKEIPAGTKITDEFLSIKQLPEKAVPKDYPSSIDDVRGRVTKTKFLPDEVITASRLVAEGAAGGLPMVIPKNYRATTLKVNEVSGLGGFVKPGDRVDVVSIVSRDEKHTFSKTILQNVLVLAAGDKIYDPEVIGEAGPIVTAQVTVALSPLDSEKLALASQTGELHLVLRPLGEEKIIATSGSTLYDLYGDLVQQEEFPQAAVANVSTDQAFKERNIIEIIQGTEKTYFYY